MLIGSLMTFIDQHSQWALLVLFVLLFLESFGLPLPGETALIACGVRASRGALAIGWVIVVAVAAAILGDNAGYWVARKGERKLLSRYRLTRRYASEYLRAASASSPSTAARPSCSAASSPSCA
jgi:membrane protein DedA with SNARE-associated domain